MPDPLPPGSPGPSWFERLAAVIIVEIAFWTLGLTGTWPHAIGVVAIAVAAPFGFIGGWQLVTGRLPGGSATVTLDNGRRLRHVRWNGLGMIMINAPIATYAVATFAGHRSGSAELIGIVAIGAGWAVCWAAYRHPRDPRLRSAADR